MATDPTASAAHDDALDAYRCPDTYVCSYARRIERDPAPASPREDHDGGDPAQESSLSHASPSAASRPSSGTVSGGAVQFWGDFDTDNTSQWELETAQNYSLRVADGGAGHRTAGRFEVRDGDTPVDSGERSEAKLPNSTDVSNGDDVGTRSR